MKCLIQNLTKTRIIHRTQERDKKFLQFIFIITITIILRLLINLQQMHLQEEDQQLLETRVKEINRLLMDRERDLLMRNLSLTWYLIMERSCLWLLTKSIKTQQICKHKLLPLEAKRKVTSPLKAT